MNDNNDRKKQQERKTENGERISFDKVLLRVPNNLHRDIMLKSDNLGVSKSSCIVMILKKYFYDSYINI